MKTHYLLFLSFLILTSALKAQTIKSTFQPKHSNSSEEKLFYQAPALVKSIEQLKLEKNENLISTSENQFSSNNFPDFKKGISQSSETGYLIDSLDTKDSQGNLIRREKYTYDNFGNRTQVSYYNWNATNVLQNASKIIYTFDNTGNQILDIGYSWDVITKVWNNTTKNELTFDSKGNQILSINYTWDDIKLVWLNQTKIELTFDNGNEIQISYYWDNTKEVWQCYDKVKKTFDTYGKQMLYENFAWDAANNIWKNVSKRESFYDSYGNLSLKNYIWDNYNHLWIVSPSASGGITDEYHYDSNGKIISHINYHWESSQLRENYKFEYTYDNNGNQTAYNYIWASNYYWKLMYKLETIYDSFGNLKFEILTNWYAPNDEWDLKYTNEYYYSIKNTVGVGEIFPTKISIYPNPAQNEIHIKGLKEQSVFILFDINGKMLMQGTVVNDDAIEISSLPKGFYSVCITNTEGKFVSKIIKK